MHDIHYLGYSTGVFNGYNYCSLYLAEKATGSNSHGFICYKKKFRGDPHSLEALHPGDIVSCTYNRYGDIADVTFLG